MTMWLAWLTTLKPRESMRDNLKNNNFTALMTSLMSSSWLFKSPRPGILFISRSWRISVAVSHLLCSSSKSYRYFSMRVSILSTRPRASLFSLLRSPVRLQAAQSQRNPYCSNMIFCRSAWGLSYCNLIKVNWTQPGSYFTATSLVK